MQTIERQRPPRQADLIAVWINPLCWRSAAPGPPGGEPIITRGMTGLIAGLFLDGGPVVPFSNPRCVSPAGTASPGTVTVANAATGRIVAVKMLASRQLASFALTPGDYTVTGVFANATNDGYPYIGTATPVTVTARHTTRQDIIAAIP